VAARIVIVDYDMGNLQSVRNAFKAVGYRAEISPDPASVLHADGIVLPGMGAFGNGMRKLAERGLDEAVTDYAASGRPLLGICLGMQLLLEFGEEYGGGPGLGLLKGSATRLPGSVKLPQIGWNVVAPVATDHPIHQMEISHEQRSRQCRVRRKPVVESGGRLVAFDVLGSGVGEHVLVATGSVASGWFGEEHPPIDALVIGSIDEPASESASGRER